MKTSTDFSRFYPKRKYAGYIFDCDGTLADSMPLHHATWVYSLKKAGATFDFDYALMCQWGGKSMAQTLTDLNALYGCELAVETVRAAQTEYILQHLPNVQPIVPIVALARELHTQAPVSVASGGHRHHVHTTLKAIGVDTLFDIVVTQEDVTHNKPAPDIFLLAAEKMGIEPQDCLVFEDSPTGIAAAQAAGMDYIKVYF